MGKGEKQRWFLHWKEGLVLGVGFFLSETEAGVRVVSENYRKTVLLPENRVRFLDRPFRVQAGNSLFSAEQGTVALPFLQGSFSYRAVKGAPGIFLAGGQAVLDGRELDLTGAVCQIWCG